MKEIVYKYLNTNYRISVASLKDYRLYDIKNKNSQSIHSVFKSLRIIFGLTDDELSDIVNPWMEAKATELHNKITDIQYKIYAATGVEITLTSDQLIALIETDDEGFETYIVAANMEEA